MKRIDSYSIRRTTYRGQQGFKLVGSGPAAGAFGVSIFSEHRDRLERIRELYRDSSLSTEQRWKMMSDALRGDVRRIRRTDRDVKTELKTKGLVAFAFAGELLVRRSGGPLLFRGGGPSVVAWLDKGMPTREAAQ